MKAIRWLHAYRRSTATLLESAQWEMSEPAERSVEPTWKGQSLVASEMDHRHTVGLGVESLDIYRQGFLVDCWSNPSESGTRIRRGTSENPAYTPSMFWRWWARIRPTHHGELITHACRIPATCVVYVRDDETGKAKAVVLAAQLNLPARSVRALGVAHD